jgi:general secretion pathway protein K
MKTELKSERGMALLVVLVVIALLSSILVELAFTSMIDMRLTETFRDRSKAYYLAKGGINAGRMILQEDRNQFDSLHETWSKGVVNYPVADGNVSINIEDEDGKLALNSIVEGNNPQTLMVDRFYRFLVAMQLDPPADPAELTAALIDWLDPGSDPYTELRTDDLNQPVVGAEDGHYLNLPNPYHCKNGPLETLQELSLIKGFSSGVLERIIPHVAVNRSLAININTASLEVLMSLDRQIDRDTAQAVVDYRQSESIKSIVQLEDFLPSESYAILKTMANLGQLTTTSETYRIESTAWVNDGRRRLVADVAKNGNKLLYLKVD